MHNSGPQYFLVWLYFYDLFRQSYFHSNHSWTNYHAGASELGGQGGHVPTHFFAWSLLKRDVCPPTFYYQWNNFWSCPPTLRKLPTPLMQIVSNGFYIFPSWVFIFFLLHTIDSFTLLKNIYKYFHLALLDIVKFLLFPLKTKPRKLTFGCP